MTLAEVPSYPKVLTLGSLGTEMLFNGPVIVQEKVDGSQFGFGKDAQGNVGLRSHRRQLVPGAADMFEPAVRHVLAVAARIPNGAGTWFYAEFLARPKHNTLLYGRAPHNHLVLFDAVVGNHWLPYGVLCGLAELLEMDVAPLLFQGEGDAGQMQSLLGHTSYLGGPQVEGIVIKNHAQLIVLGGKVYPLFCKLVRDDFKETNRQQWAAQSHRVSVEAYINGFQGEARWQKAVQRLRDDGRLLGAVQDIGPLIHEVDGDVREEEAENIKGWLYQHYIRDIVRAAQRGLPEWYKAKLREEAGMTM